MCAWVCVCVFVNYALHYIMQSIVGGLVPFLNAQPAAVSYRAAIFHGSAKRRTIETNKRAAISTRNANEISIALRGEHISARERRISPGVAVWLL